MNLEILVENRFRDIFDKIIKKGNSKLSKKKELLLNLDTG